MATRESRRPEFAGRETLFKDVGDEHTCGGLTTQHTSGTRATPMQRALLSKAEEAAADEAAAAAAAAAAAHRRHQLIVALLAADVGNGQGPQGKKQRDTEFDWAAHVARLTAAEFKLRYRLTAEAFYRLLARIKPHLCVSEKQALCSKGTLIEPATKLAMSLRFLAGGAVLDIKLIYHVSKSMVFHCLWLVVDAINLTYPIEFPIDDVERLKVYVRPVRPRLQAAHTL